MRWRSGAWRFDDVVPRTHDASALDSNDDDGAAERVQGSTSSITQNDQCNIDWDEIDGAQRPAMEAARLLHTARQMVDTSRWWLMRWPRNATALLVRAGSLKDDEASKLFRALRVTAVRFGLELAVLPKARHDAKEATDARTALRKRWVATVEKLGPGHRTKRGAEMPDWVAVAHLPSYKVRRTLHRWSVEVPRAVMPNRQRTMHSFDAATGARLPANLAPPALRAAEPERPVEGRSRDEQPRQTAPEGAAQRQHVAGARGGGATATLPRERRNGISRVPAPWGLAPQQDALRGVIQRPMQPPTAGGLSWWLWPLRGGHGRGLRRFAAVVAEVFAPSWWSRRRSFIHRHKNNAKNRFTCDFRLFHHRNLLGVCASSRHLRRQAIFSAKS